MLVYLKTVLSQALLLHVKVHILNQCPVLVH